MEKIKGKDLREQLKINKTPFSEYEAKNIFYQMCCAVNYLHKLGIIQRDLKLDNFMFTDEKC